MRRYTTKMQSRIVQKNNGLLLHKSKVEPMKNAKYDDVQKKNVSIFGDFSVDFNTFLHFVYKT